MMPSLVTSGAVLPLQSVVVEGEYMLERAEQALAMLREGVSGQRLVWQVSKEGE